MKIWNKWIVGLLFIGLFLAGCSSQETGQNPSQAQSTGKIKEGGTLTIGTTADPDTLNPVISNTTPGAWVNNLIYPTLLTMDENAEKVPYLAKSIKASNDAKTFTIKLRKGLKWQDGEPITSEDVKFTGEYEHKANLRFTAAYFDNVKSVETPDDDTVVYHMKSPYPTFGSVMGYWVKIIPKHIWKDKLDNPKNFTNDKPIGAGPFKLVKWKKGEYVELKAVDKWFAGKPHLDKVIFRIYPDINTMVLALQNGEIDVTATPLPESAIPQLKANPNIKIKKTTSLGYAYYSFNLKPKNGPSPTQDPVFRKAMATATDKKAIINTALQGDGMIIDTPMSPIYSDWVNPDAKAPDYDPEKAKSMLAKAGYKDTDHDGILNAPKKYGGKNVSLELTYDTNDSFHQKATKVLKENAKKIGVDLKLKPVEYNTMVTKVMNESDFEMHMGKWGAFDEPRETFNTLFNSKADLNFMGVDDPKLDKVMKDAVITPNEEDAKQDVFKEQEWFINNFPVVPIYVQKFNLAYNSKNFDGFKVFPGDLEGLVAPNSLIHVYQK